MVVVAGWGWGGRVGPYAHNGLVSGTFMSLLIDLILWVSNGPNLQRDFVLLVLGARRHFGLHPWSVWV